MATTNLRKVGGSVMLAVPPVLLQWLQLEPGATVDIAVEDGRLIVVPQRKPPYTLGRVVGGIGLFAAVATGRARVGRIPRRSAVS